MTPVNVAATAVPSTCATPTVPRYQRVHARVLLGPLVEQGDALEAQTAANNGGGPTSHVHYRPFMIEAVHHFSNDRGDDVVECRKAAFTASFEAGSLISRGLETGDMTGQRLAEQVPPLVP